MTRARTWAPWLIALVVLLGALGYAQTTSGERLMARTGLKQRPERYTALSFTHVEALPYSAVTGTALSFSITIDNHEGKPVLYKLDASGVGTTTASAHRAILVRSGASSVVTIKTRFRCVPPRVTPANSPPTARIRFSLSPSDEYLTHTSYCRSA